MQQPPSVVDAKLLDEVADHLDSRGYAHGRWIAHARAVRQAADALQSAQQEIERLRGERDEALAWREQRQVALDNLVIRAQSAESQLSALKGRVGELVEAASDVLLGISLRNRLHADAPSRMDDFEGPVITALSEAAIKARALLSSPVVESEDTCKPQ